MARRIKFLLLIVFLSSTILSAQTTSPVNILDISLDSTGLLRWTISYQAARIKGKVQQFKGNKWISSGKGFTIIYVNFLPTQPTLIHRDSAQMVFDSGENKFRIKITTPNKIISREVVFNNISDGEELLIKDNKEIILGEQMTYDIFDQRGVSAIKGRSKKINIQGLYKGVYYFRANGKWKQFIKK